LESFSHTDSHTDLLPFLLICYPIDFIRSASIAVQKEINARNTGLPENRRMQFRIGINLGDVIQEESLIYGDGVNIAARLEGLAEGGGICISKTAFDHIESKLPYSARIYNCSWKIQKSLRSNTAWAAISMGLEIMPKR
jgi:class 3 adenylate cyclase